MVCGSTQHGRPALRLAEITRGGEKKRGARERRELAPGRGRSGQLDRDDGQGGAVGVEHDHTTVIGVVCRRVVAVVVAVRMRVSGRGAVGEFVNLRRDAGERQPEHHPREQQRERARARGRLRVGVETRTHAREEQG